MNTLKSLYNRFSCWLLYIFTGKQIFHTKFLDDPPTQIKSRTVYIIGSSNYVWSAMMKCPCGCNELIHLNLLPKGRPRWTHVIQKNKSVTLHPSVWRTKGCRSHFFLKNGAIKWCKSPSTLQN